MPFKATPTQPELTKPEKKNVCLLQTKAGFEHIIDEDSYKEIKDYMTDIDSYRNLQKYVFACNAGTDSELTIPAKDIESVSRGLREV